MSDLYEENKRIRIAKFNACFKEINDYQGRYRIFVGGAGSGKSVNIAQDFLLKLIQPKYAGANLLVIRKTMVSHRDSTFHQLCAAAENMFGDTWSSCIEVKQSPLRMICKSTGNEILFRGVFDSYNREQLKSLQPRQGKLCWVWCEESSELLPEDLEVLDDRLRGQLPDHLYYQITCSFNPIASGHWLKKRFFDQEHESCMISRTTYMDNRFIDAEFQKRMERRKEYDPEGYRIYALGEWGDLKGKIFTNYKIQAFDMQSRYFDAMAYGTDFGFHHAHATLLLGWRDGDVYICKEKIFYEQDSHEIIAQLGDDLDRSLIMWCDSAEPDRIKTLRRNNWQARAVKKEHGSVLSQIDWLKARTIFIHPTCTHTIEEIEQWQWKRDLVTGEWLDEPINDHDDAMAALRYGIEGWRRSAGISFN